MRLRTASISILMASLFALPGFGAESSKAVKANLIEEYLVITEAENTIEEALRLAFEQSDDQIAESLGYSAGDLEEMDAEGKLEYAEAIASQKRMMSKLVDRLLARVDLKALTREVSVPVLDRYYAEADLRSLIAFYKTPTGQKLVENQARIGIDIQFATQKVLMPLMMEVIGELQKEEEEAENRAKPWKKAMADMRTIATVVEAYATDENDYPSAVTIAALASMVEPTYVRQLPQKDPWGVEYVYMVSPDQAQYRIICGGADGSIDGSSRVIAAYDDAAGGGRENRSMDDDIIYQDGAFVTWAPGSGINQ